VPLHPSSRRPRRAHRPFPSAGCASDIHDLPQRLPYSSWRRERRPARCTATLKSKLQSLPNADSATRSGREIRVDSMGKQSKRLSRTTSIPRAAHPVRSRRVDSVDSARETVPAACCRELNTDSKLFERIGCRELWVTTRSCTPRTRLVASLKPTRRSFEYVARAQLRALFPRQTGPGTGRVRWTTATQVTTTDIRFRFTVDYKFGINLQLGEEK
jgi:hypothetical protein